MSSGTTPTNASCTFNNSIVEGTLIVEKVVVNDNGGTLNANDFSFQVDGGTAQAFEADGHNELTVNPGTYNVTEPAVSGYTTSYNNCSNVVVPPGGSATCVITNDDQQATLIVNKIVINDNGGILEKDDFSFQVNGGTITPFDTDGINEVYVNAGTYTVTEPTVSGYSTSYNNCSNIVLTNGQTQTCYITNNDLPGNIKIIKNTVGADGTFDFTITGPSPLTPSVTTTSNTGDTGLISVNAGSYNVSETVPADWDLTSSSCDSGAPSNFTVPNNGTVTCTFTNTKRRDITACKFNDVNGNGVKDDGDLLLDGWDMTLNPGNVVQTTVNGCTTFSNLAPGGYSVTETLKTDWDNTTDLLQNVTLTANQNETVYFGNFRCATISGQKWEDINGNGQKDLGDNVLSGWTINLSGPETNSTTTNADGNYSFKVCSAGNYTVTESFPDSNWYQTYPGGTSPNHQVTVTSGGDYPDQEFGNTKYARIWGIKYRDDDGNGVIDASDAGTTLAGWVFDLYDGITNAVLGTYTTLADGFYEFTNLLVGKSYYVKEQPQASWTQTIGSPSPTPMTLQSGDDKQVDFANFENVSVTACKLEDADGDKDTTADDQTPIAGWSVNLIKNGDAANKDTKTTGETGCYTWTDLGPGSYSVSEEVQTGWTNLTPTTNDFGIVTSGSSNSFTFINSHYGKIIVKKMMIGGTASFNFTGDVSGSINSDGATLETENVLPGRQYSSTESTKSGWDLTDINCDDANSNGDTSLRTATFNVEPGETVTCTFTNTKRGSIAGRKYDDLNSNGSYNSGETYLDGWTIRLFDDIDLTNEISQMNTGDTGTQGQYKFTNLVQGTYYVCEDLKPGWSQTQPSSGLIKDSAYCREVTVGAGQNITGQHFGNFKLGIIQSRKYNDLNNDSTRDTGEPYLDGWTIKLYKQGEGWQEVDSKVTGHTGTLGQYRFEDLDLGTYYICEVLQSGWAQTDPASNEGYANQSGQGDEASRCRRVIIDQSGDESIGEKHFGNQIRGSITIAKNTNPASNGDFTFTSGQFETFYLDNGSNQDFTNLGNNTYDFTESIYPGWTLTGLKCIGDTDAVVNLETRTATATIDEPGETVSCTFTNTRDTGSLELYKIIDIDGNTGTTDDQTPGENWQFDVDGGTGDTTDASADTTDSKGLVTFSSLKTGEYTAIETVQDGYDLIDAYCSNESGEFDDVDSIDGLEVKKDSITTCYFYNSPNSTLHGYKWDDADMSGGPISDFGEDLLPGWTINLYKDNGEGYDFIDSMVTDNAEHLGWYWFEHLFPGDYKICEEIQVGWQQTYPLNEDDNCHLVTLPVGDSGPIPPQEAENYVSGPMYNFGNQRVNPELQLSKSNDGSNESPGGTVIYTLKLKVLNSKALGVKIKDLLPKGFTFDHIISSTLNGSPITLGDPGYHSPGTYNLGDLDADDEVIIQYQAKIDGSQEFGLFKDLAWAQGTDLLDNKVLALAQSEGYVDTNFVGTAVRVDGNITESGNTSLQGDVLGASTQRILPATGGNQIWVIIASIMTGLGLLIMLLGVFMKKIKLFLVIALLVIGYGLFGVGSVNAANLSIRVSEPKTPTKNTDFKLVFTVMDLTESGNPITAKCFYKKTLADAWIQFDTDKAISAGGNSDSCQVNSSIVNTSGQTYYFKATATNGVDSDDSEAQGLVAVGYDDRDPSVPTNYRKEKISDCQYKISFKTADDGQTSRVEVYRSDSTSFNLDGSTRVGDITIGSNTEGSFTESVPDCGKAYYYVIRAFNSAGNASGPTGDSGVTTTSSTTTTTTTEGEAIPVANANIPQGGAGGQVLGEETNEITPSPEPEVIEVKEREVTGTVKGAVMGMADFIKKKTKLSLLIALIVLGLGYGIYYFIKKKK